jgi:integrase
LTCQLVTSWARDEAKRATPLTWARRLEVIRPFARHRARIEPGTYVPEANTFGRSRRRLAPHLYTDREIVDLLAAAGRPSPKGTMRSATYRALFGLIAATGLRVSEALRLKCADVDLDAGMLTVRQTKFTKSRLVPLHRTTTRALKHYLANMRETLIWRGRSHASTDARWACVRRLTEISQFADANLLGVNMQNNMRKAFITARRRRQLAGQRGGTCIDLANLHRFCQRKALWNSRISHF